MIALFQNVFSTASSNQSASKSPDVSVFMTNSLECIEYPFSSTSSVHCPDCTASVFDKSREQWIRFSRWGTVVGEGS